MISASKQGNFTSSVFLTNARGKVNQPTVYTGSLASNESFSINTISTGSGTLNFSEPYVLSINSASLIIQHDVDDPSSMVFTAPTSSLGVSRTTDTLMYFSGSGKIGFNTKNPKNAIDFKADSFKIRSTDGKREMQFSDDGRLSTRKFSDSAVSESIGSEIILSYTPGTFLSPKKAQVGETIGTINFVDESFNTSTLSKYFKSGSVAQITSTVRKVTGLGAAGDLQFKVNVDPEAPQDTLVSFMDIDPLTHGTTVYFPYGITSNTHITASGNISSSGELKGNYITAKTPIVQLSSHNDYNTNTSGLGDINQDVGNEQQLSWTVTDFSDTDYFEVSSSWGIGVKQTGRYRVSSHAKIYSTGGARSGCVMQFYTGSSFGAAADYILPPEYHTYLRVPSAATNKANIDAFNYIVQLNSGSFVSTVCGNKADYGDGAVVRFSGSASYFNIEYLG